MHSLVNMMGSMAGHGLSALLGAGSCLLCLGFFYALGVGVAGIVAGKSARCDPQFCSVIGAAIFVLAAWHGLHWAIPIPVIVAWLCAALFPLWLVAVRWRGAVNLFRPRQVMRFVLGYLVLYLAAYCLAPASLFGTQLPYRLTTVNNDLFHYVNVARYLLDLRFDNIAPGYYLSEAYWVTPGAYHFLALLGIPFGGQVLAASMALVYGTIALIGVAVAGIVHRIFRASRLMGTLVALVVISGSFFQYVYGSAFLAQFCSSSVLLLGTSQLASRLHRAGRTHMRADVIWMWPYVLLTFYIYPAICVIFIAMASVLSCGAEVLILLVGRVGSEPRQWFGALLRVMPKWSVVVAAVLLLVVIADPVHAYAVVTGYVPKLGSAPVGWKLDLVPFNALMGTGPIQATARWNELSIVLGLGLIALSLYAYLICGRGAPTRAQQMLVVMGAIAYVTYLAYFSIGYFARVAGSYQQWKLASYLPLLFSFVFYPTTAHLAALALTRARADGLVSRRMRWASCLLVVLLALVANVTARVDAWGSDRRNSTEFAHVREVPRLGKFDAVYVHMRDVSRTMLTPYFITGVPLHFLSWSYYPLEAYDPQKIDARHPLLWDGAQCDTAADAVQIEGVGCLMREHPQMHFARSYGFDERSLPAIDLLSPGSGPESWGRWTDGPHARITAYAAADIVQRGRGYLNLRVRIYATGARARLHLNQKSSAPVNIDDEHMASACLQRWQGTCRERWLSIPYDTKDWSGTVPARIELDLDLLDTVFLHDVDAASGDMRRIGWGFSEASFSEAPRGEVVGLAAPNAPTAEP